MALTSEEIDLVRRTLRVEWLKDILDLYRAEDNGVKTIRASNLKRMIINAEADLLALTDSEAAERRRQIQPEW